MNDTCAALFIIFRLLYKHRVKAGHRGKNSTTKPCTVLSIGWRVNFGEQVGWRQGLNFLLHAVSHALKHGAATSEHDVAEQVSPDVFFTLDNRLVRVLVDSIRLAIIHILAP